MDCAVDERQVVFLDSDVVLRGSYMVVAATEVAHGEDFRDVRYVVCFDDSENFDVVDEEVVERRTAWGRCLYASERKDFPWCLIALRLSLRIRLVLTQLPVKCSTFTFVGSRAADTLNLLHIAFQRGKHLREECRSRDMGPFEKGDFLVAPVQF